MNRYIVTAVPGISNRFYVLDLVESRIASIAHSLDVARHIANHLNQQYDSHVSDSLDTLSPDHKLGLDALNEYHQDPNKLALDELCDDGGICD